MNERRRSSFSSGTIKAAIILQLWRAAEGDSTATRPGTESRQPNAKTLKHSPPIITQTHLPYVTVCKSEVVKELVLGFTLPYHIRASIIVGVGWEAAYFAAVVILARFILHFSQISPQSLWFLTFLQPPG
jgi:hypothetical protein